MDTQERAGKLQHIIAKAWMDEGFKKRLFADPAAVLKEQGVEMPPGIQVKILENTENVFYLVLPTKAPCGELSGQELSAVAGGNNELAQTIADLK